MPTEITFTNMVDWIDNTLPTEYPQWYTPPIRNTTRKPPISAKQLLIRVDPRNQTDLQLALNSDTVLNMSTSHKWSYQLDSTFFKELLV